jgi:hypothetical protein
MPWSVACLVGGQDDSLYINLPALLQMKKKERIVAYFEPFGMTSPFAGISPADLHNRAPRVLSLITHRRDNRWQRRSSQ